MFAGFSRGNHADHEHNRRTARARIRGSRARCRHGWLVRRLRSPAGLPAAHRGPVRAWALRLRGGDVHRGGPHGRLVREPVLSRLSLPVRCVLRRPRAVPAGMWAYRARDAVATAMHGTWGSFWMAYGLLQLLLVTGVLADRRHARFGPRVLVHRALRDHLLGHARSARRGEHRRHLGARHACGRFRRGGDRSASSTRVEKAAGWVFVVSAVLAWYVATG